MIRLLLFVAVVALAGCGGKPKVGTAEAEAALPTKTNAPGPAKPRLDGKIAAADATPVNLVPHTVGTQWTYSVESAVAIQGQPPAQAKTEWTLRVAAVRKVGDKTRFQLQTIRDGKRVDEQVWMADASGLYQYSQGTAGKPFTPPQPIVKFPIVPAGPAFTWKGTVPTPGKTRNAAQLEGKVIGIQPANTDMGSAQAIFVESITVFDLPKKAQGRTVTDTFFRPGVGIVRYQQATRIPGGTSVTTLRLKDYTIR